MENITDRFLTYISYDTKADEKATDTPSSKGQMVFANYLKEELEKLSLQNIILTEKGYLYATLPSNSKKNNIPKIGFIAHIDTSPGAEGKNIKPRIIKNYDGKDIVLHVEKNIILSTKQYPEILNYTGQDIIVTDGTTLLGSDDKAGITAIISAIEYLTLHTEIEHGDIQIAFTPDEEIGRGADYFDTAIFDAQWAYTIDGGEVGELEYENFNAASVVITIQGTNVHPGYAKNKMVNSLLVANEIINHLSDKGLPQNTENREGFFHVDAMEGNVEKTVVNYIIRDFEKDSFEKRKNTFKMLISRVNEKYGKETATIVIKDQYYNMKEKISPSMHIIDIAEDAMKELGITPKISPIRGGTDGARLSFMGLPCPNIFAGGHNFHSRYEYIPVQSMEKSMKTILKIIEKNIDKNRC